LGSSVWCDTFSLTLDFSFLINFLCPDFTMMSLFNNSHRSSNNRRQTKRKGFNNGRKAVRR
jgi:hypothetical protein